MNLKPYSVSVVVDRNYGQLLHELIESGPVWDVESPTNREASQHFWKSSPSHTHLDGVTLFKATEASSPEEMLVGWMDAIELHHRVYSADPPYTAIRVIGATEIHSTNSSPTINSITGPRGSLLTGASVAAKRQSPMMSGKASSVAAIPNSHLFSLGKTPGTILQKNMKSPNKSDERVANERNQ